MDQALSLLIPGLVVAGMFIAGLLVGRRIVKQPPAPEEVLADARIEAQRILARAEEEARALADTYRDREEATLEHRKVEMGTMEDRIDQRAANGDAVVGRLRETEVEPQTEVGVLLVGE